MDRFYTTGLFLGENNDATKTLAYKPTGISVGFTRNDPNFYLYPDTRSIQISADNSPETIGDNQTPEFVFLVGSGSEQNSYTSYNEKSVNLAFTFERGKTASISTHEIELKGKVVYGESFNLTGEYNLYLGAKDSDNSCCVGGFVSTFQKQSLEIPEKQGSEGLSLVTPTPTITISPTPSITPPNTPSVTPTISISPSNSVTPTICLLYTSDAADE